MTFKLGKLVIEGGWRGVGRGDGEKRKLEIIGGKKRDENKYSSYTNLRWIFTLLRHKEKDTDLRLLQTPG